MATQVESDLQTARNIMKQFPLSDDEDKPRHSYETVPKLPTVKITHKTANVPHLADFIDPAKTEEHKRSGFHLEPVGREKAFAILKQYNKLVSSSDATLTVKNLPPLKFNMKKNFPPPSLPKHDVTPRKLPIFTEGISSISKSTKPSFVIPKDKVLRANLPNNIIVAQKKDKFTLGVKPQRRKSPKRENDESVKFKQMHNLGLDSLPIVNLEKYMKTKASVQNGVKGVKPLINGNRRVRPRRLEPLNSDPNIKTSHEAARSFDFAIGRRKGHRWNEQNSAPTDSKAKVVWVGKQLGTEFANNKARLLKSIHEQYEKPTKYPGDNPHQSKRDPTVLGVCSLAPFDIIGQSKLIVGDIRVPGSYRVFPSNHVARSNVNDYFFESSSDSSLNTDWKNMINNVVTNRSSSIGSGTATPQGYPNPPPSYVSSSANDEEEIQIPVEVANTMHRIQEERSSLMESASKSVPRPLSTKSEDNKMSPAPIITINEPVDEESDEQLSQPKTTPRKSKEPLFSNIIEIKMEPKRLNVPKLIESELRPPIKTEGTESLSYGSSDPPRSKVSLGATEVQKVNYKTLELEPRIERKSPVATTEKHFLHVPNSHVHHHVHRHHEKHDNNNNNDDLLKPIINSKTLKFVSPLKTQSNAKRQ